MWIDSHSHLNDQAFRADYQEVLDRAMQDGVEAIVVVGFDLPSSEWAVELANREKIIWAAVGIHPHDAKTWDQPVSERITQLLADPKVVALGEIGLDYHYNYSTREEQLNAFEEQLAMAHQYNKPVIIHSRESAQDTMKVLTGTGKAPLSGVMHCFSGSMEMAEQCLNLGLYISFAGPLTFPNAVKPRAVAERIPLDRLLVETDCPYLSPHPFRGKRNEPAHVGLVGMKLAEVKTVPVGLVEQVTTANCKVLFKIP